MFACPYPGCSKKYSTKGGLQLHIKSSSGGREEKVTAKIDKKFKCDVIGCDKAFVRRTDLKIHKLRVHTDVKPHACTFPSCDKVRFCGCK